MTQVLVQCEDATSKANALSNEARAAIAQASDQARARENREAQAAAQAAKLQEQLESADLLQTRFAGELALVTTSLARTVRREHDTEEIVELRAAVQANADKKTHAAENMARDTLQRSCLGRAVMLYNVQSLWKYE